jgi:hypothetical protein
MHDRDVATLVTLFTVEFTPDGDGTLLLLTDQSAFLDAAETPAARPFRMADQRRATCAVPGE